MTQSNTPSFLGPPPPIIEPTVEQSFKLRRLEDLLPKADKEDIITLFMALQRQNFALANTVSNLVKTMANSPAYYTRGSIECWDFIRDQQLNYHLGCAIKYICRAGHKDSKVKDLKKAIHYLENELYNTLKH